METILIIVIDLLAVGAGVFWHNEKPLQMALIGVATLALASWLFRYRMY